MCALGMSLRLCDPRPAGRSHFPIGQLPFRRLFLCFKKMNFGACLHDLNRKCARHCVCLENNVFNVTRE